MKYYLIVVLVIVGCNQQDLNQVEIQGHRGARGLAPENTIPAFLKALDYGVNVLELDLVVSKDRQLVVSHEPYFNHVICADSLGNEIPMDSVINLYQLNYSEIRSFDCGSKGNPKFPYQDPETVHKPLLKEVFDVIKSRDRSNEITFNIELKTKKHTDDIFHPAPGAFTELVYDFLKQEGMLDRITIQSFDFRTLQYFNQKYPEVPLVLLIENELDWKINIDSLGFQPEIYSPYYPLLSRESIEEIRSLGMKVVPWTVNGINDMQQLIKWGVDGIITDYPDSAQLAIKEL